MTTSKPRRIRVEIHVEILVVSTRIRYRNDNVESSSNRRRNDVESTSNPRRILVEILVESTRNFNKDSNTIIIQNDMDSISIQHHSCIVIFKDHSFKILI